MSYSTVNYKHSGLNLSAESLGQSEALQKWSELIASGYQGWAQWTDQVVRLRANTSLPHAQGTLLAGECFKGNISYKLNNSITVYFC